MSDEALLLAFWCSLGVTVVALVAVIVTAKLHRIPAHLGAVAAFVLVLVVTLVFAELLGQRFDFEPLPSRVHLTFAFSTAGFLLAPLATGWRHWRGKGSIVAHKRAVYVFLALVAGAVSTGVWMFSGRRPAEPRPALLAPSIDDRRGLVDRPG